MSTPDVSKLRVDRTPDPRRRRARRWPWLVVLAAAAAGGAWWAFVRPQAIPVQAASVVSAWPSQQFLVISATGYVVAQRKAAVASKATGRLEWLGVAEGSRVKAGEVIARLDSRDVSAQLDSARAAVAVAEANLVQAQAEAWEAAAALRRAQELVAKGFVSQASVDTALARGRRADAAVGSARAAVAVAEANARAARIAVDFTLIRAPFDGVVLSKSANVGDIVTPFSSAVDSKGAVVNMADMSTLEVEADVSESSLARIAVGQPCEITLDALPDARFRGEVSRMVPTVDRAKATVMTKVRFLDLDARILPEMSAKVSFLSQPVSAEQQKPYTAVPAQALVRRNGGSAVYVLRDGTAREVPVQPGARAGELVGVGDAPISPGERVVLHPGERVRDGVVVRVEQK